jgi:hypothetical protein
MLSWPSSARTTEHAPRSTTSGGNGVGGSTEARRCPTSGTDRYRRSPLRSRPSMRLARSWNSPGAPAGGASDSPEPPIDSPLSTHRPRRSTSTANESGGQISNTSLRTCSPGNRSGLTTSSSSSSGYPTCHGSASQRSGRWYKPASLRRAAYSSSTTETRSEATSKTPT